MSKESKPINATPLYIFAAVVVIAGVGYFVINDMRDKEAAKIKAEQSRRNGDKALRISAATEALARVERCGRLVRATNDEQDVRALGEARFDALNALDAARQDLGDAVIDDYKAKVRAYTP